MELTPAQVNILERLHSRGLEIVAFPMYESVVGVRKGDCAALLAPAGPNAFAVQGQPTYLIGGNLTARVKRPDGHYFVRKQEQLEATPERLAELEAFTAELAEALLPVAQSDNQSQRHATPSSRGTCGSALANFAFRP